MSDKIKILVCVHKECELPKDDIYLPIQVGKALSDIDLGIQGDDTGDNISVKNLYYCELTAHYWAWKNMKDYDYIGLCHYRRYFDLSSIKVKKKIEFDKIFSKYDIILAKPRSFPYSNTLSFIELMTIEDIFILINIIKTHYPEYEKTMIDYLYNSNQHISFNMFITSQKYFEEYSTWLFNVLSLVKNKIKFSEYTRMKRVLAYMGEVLLPIYCITNNLKIKYFNIVPNPCMKKTISSKFKSKINYIRYYISFKLISPFKHKNAVVGDSVLIGLKKDGIDFSIDKI
jgi:hypothetical protein